MEKRDGQREVMEEGLEVVNMARRVKGQTLPVHHAPVLMSVFGEGPVALS